MSISLILLSFLGLIAGYALTLIAPEEVKPYQRAYSLLFSVCCALSLYLAFSAVSVAVGIIAAFSGFILVRIFAKKFFHFGIIYSLSPLLILISENIYLVIAVYLMGLPLANMLAEDLIADDRINKRFVLAKRLLINNGWFLLLALPLSFL